MHHRFCAIEKPRHIQSHDGRWNHAKIRKGGIAPADARGAVEDVSETVRFGHFLHFRARVCYGDKPAARFPRAHDLPGPLEKVLFKDIGLERAA